MRRLAILTICAASLTGFAVAIGGCSFLKEQKAENHRQWYQARSQIIYGVGCEHLKVGDLDKALSCATEALRLDKDYLPARILLGKVLLGKGRYAAAADELRKAESAEGGTSAEISYLLGETLEKRGQYAEALRCYQKARVLEPSNEAYVTASAEVLVSLGRPRQALELLEARLSSAHGGAGEPAMLAIAGELAMLVDAPAKAVIFFQRCLDARPKSLAIRESLAKAHFFAARREPQGRTRRYTEALEQLQILQREDKKNPKSEIRNPQSNWLYIMMGDCYMALNRHADAKATYETAAKIESADAPVWISLAKAAIATGDGHRAVLAAQRAFYLNPLLAESAEAAVVLACAMLLENRPREAMETLAPAARKHPADPALWCMLGQCYHAQGFADRAVACYMVALRANPKHHLAKNLLAAATKKEGLGTRD